MLQTKTVNKSVVAVANDPTEILLRKHGKAEFGQERVLCVVKDDTAEFHADVAEAFGLTVKCELTGAKKTLLDRFSQCEECMSECCIWNPEGICMYPVVTGKQPKINDDDGCLSYIDNESIQFMIS